MLNVLTSLFLRLNKPLQFPKFKLVVDEMDPGGKQWRAKMRPLKVAADYFHILRVVCSWDVKVSQNIHGKSHKKKEFTLTGLFVKIIIDGKF